MCVCVRGGGSPDPGADVERGTGADGPGVTTSRGLWWNVPNSTSLNAYGPAASEETACTCALWLAAPSAAILATAIAVAALRLRAAVAMCA